MTLTLLMLAGACSPDRLLQGADRAAVLQYSEPIADNLLQGINQHDYSEFSKDFDSHMKSAIPEQAFQNQVIGVVAGRTGNFVSRQVSQVVQNGDQVTLVYSARFDKENNVIVTLTLTAAAPHQVSGLFFDSTSLE